MEAIIKIQALMRGFLRRMRYEALSFARRSTQIPVALYQHLYDTLPGGSTVRGGDLKWQDMDPMRTPNEYFPDPFKIASGLYSLHPQSTSRQQIDYDAVLKSHKYGLVYLLNKGRHSVPFGEKGRGAFIWEYNPKDRANIFWDNL